MVGVKGFEPSAPWSQTKCANQTALHPDKTEILSKNNSKVKDFHHFILKKTLIKIKILNVSCLYFK